MTALSHRIPEPEVMSDAEEARAYRAADFTAVNQAFADRFADLWAAVPERPGRPAFADLGCGPPDISARVARAVPGCRVTAVDASEAMLREGLAALRADPVGDAVLCVRADVKRLPLADASLDAVFSNSLLHHLADPLPFWREVLRVLRPGGLVFVRDLHRPGTLREASDLVDLHAARESPLLKTLFFNSLLAAFTTGELERQLADAGLAGLAVEKVTDRHVDVFGLV